jgi:hypothetical protein
MKKLILILPIFFLSACASLAMNNEKIIKESKFCEEAGLNPKTFRNFFGEIILIQCEPINTTP